MQQKMILKYLLLNTRVFPADGLIISKNKYGHRTFFADNWPNRAHNWMPCVDDPADKASVEFIVTAPSTLPGGSQRYSCRRNQSCPIIKNSLIGKKMFR